MKYQHALLVTLIMLSLAAESRADQHQYISKSNAAKCTSLLNNYSDIALLCEPCGEQLCQKIHYDSTHSSDVENNYQEIEVDDKPIDLAYAYVFRKGRWENIAFTLGLQTEGVSSTLSTTQCAEIPDDYRSVREYLQASDYLFEIRCGKCQGDSLQFLAEKELLRCKVCLDSVVERAEAETTCINHTNIATVGQAIVQSAILLAHTPEQYVNKYSKAFSSWVLGEDWYTFRAIYEDKKQTWRNDVLSIKECISDQGQEKGTLYFEPVIETYLSAIDKAIAQLESCDLETYGCVYRAKQNLLVQDKYLNGVWKFANNESKPHSKRRTPKPKSDRH